LIRKGRFDEIFFVDLPNLQTRAEILQIHAATRAESACCRGCDAFSSRRHDGAGWRIALLGKEPHGGGGLQAPSPCRDIGLAHFV